jgi:hypothetical protein
MALDGLVGLPPVLKAKLPLFYQKSLVMQELVLKIFFSLAISREDLAIKKVFGPAPDISMRMKLAHEFRTGKQEQVFKSEEYALAYILERKLELFKVLLAFMPEAEHRLGLEYLEGHANLDMSSQALGLLQLLGKTNKRMQQLHQEIKEELLPRYALLAKCLEDYVEAEQAGDHMNLALLAENVVLALRGDKCITAGPQTIAKMSLKPSPKIVQLEDASRKVCESSILKK